ncbi:MAG: tetratricopeptide repeat protein [Ferruginibacter sp.]|nr:tetratricopeptide repeat protein [Cytophagales bacterium]
MKIPAWLFIALLALLLGASPLRAQSKVDHLKPAVAQLPSQAQSEVDSLKGLLKTTSRGIRKINLYEHLCLAHAGTLGQMDLARQYADSVKWLADQSRNPSGLASSSYCRAVIARYDGKYSEALGHLRQQINHCEAAGDSSQLVKGLFQMAVVHKELGNYQQSLATHYRIIRIYEKNRLPYDLGITFMGVGNLLVHLQKYENAIQMYHRALAIFEGLPVSLEVRMSRLRTSMNLGNAYLKMKQFERAKSIYEQALLVSDSLGSKRTAATCLMSIGEILNGLGQHDSALVYHLRALAIREQNSQKDKLVINLLRIGETYLALEDHLAATRYLLEALALAKKCGAKPCARDAYEKLATLYATQRNFPKAYEYHRLFSVMKDSVLNEETARQLGELQTRYETGEKDKRIALLAKEKEVQQKEAQRQATLKKALTGGLGLVSMLAGLLVYTFRQRLRNQRIVAAKNDEIREANFKRQVSDLETRALRAQMNPHFLFNCLNSINRMILEGDAENASRYLTKFSKLIRLILENSESAAVSLQNELAMLESYLQLEDLRFKGRIGYRITVDESIDQENTYLPSMVLQPFVENAIWHGLMHKEKAEPGCIRISIRETEDVLKCVIEDNGVGREQATALKKTAALNSKSMGLQITEERLKLFNQGKTGSLIRITDLKDSLNRALGTRVDIHVPLA